MTGRPALAADPRHVALALAVAASFGRRYPRLADEFESEAYVALCQAAATFDPALGASFRSHASARVAGAMRDVRRMWCPKGYRGPGAVPPRVDPLGRPDDPGSPASGAGPVGWELEYEDEVRGLARRTPRGAGRLFSRLHAHAGTATLESAARHFGLCRARAQQLHAAALGRLRERFAGDREMMMRGDVNGRSQR